MTMNTDTPAPNEDIPAPEDNEEESDLDDDKKKKVEANIQARLARQASNHEKDKAILLAEKRQKEAEIEILKQQLQARQNGSAQPQAQTAAGPGAATQMPPQVPQAPQIDPQRVIAEHEFNKKLSEAAEKDPEFKKLAGDTNTPQAGLPIHPDLKPEFMHLNNAPAVMKHLMKNEKDHAVLQSMMPPLYNTQLMTPEQKQQYSMMHMTAHTQRLKFFNELSNKLEDNQQQPQPSEYEPDPDFSSQGSGSQDFDLDNYVKTRGGVY